MLYLWDMRRLLALTTSLVLTTSFILAAPSFGASPKAKAGGKCIKLGETRSIGSLSLSCTKSGKKLIWKLISINPNKPTTSTTTTFKASIPITLPVSQNGAITFANVPTKIDDLGQIAWQKVQDVLSTNTAPTTISNDVHVGPNTKISITGGLSRIQEILARAQKTFSGFTQVKTFSMLIYNAKDEPWAETEWSSFATARGYFAGQIMGEKNTIAGNCRSTISPGVFSGEITNCGGADSSAIQNKDDAILTFGESDSGTSGDTYINNGGVVGHEYVHAVQAAQWIGNPKVYCTAATNSPDCFRSHWVNNTIPCWLNEGSANSIGPLIASKSLSEYLDYRKNNLPYGQGPTTVTDYSEQSLKDYLFKQVIGDRGCISDGSVYRLGYTVGALAAEILTAIGGPQSVMALYSLGAEGNDFPTAFAKVYGISWSEASSIIAKTLAAEYATFGPAPK